MLYTISAMADQVGECTTINALLLKNGVKVKEEECQDEDFVDDKVNISETAIIADNIDLKDHSICDKIKYYDVSTTLDNIKSELCSTDVQHDMTPDNVKIEKGINADSIKVEFSNRLLYCEGCEAYCEDYCGKCEMLVHIMNNTVPINADNRLQEELPNDSILEIRDYFGQFCVFALKVIPVGVRFGPFTGMNITELPWKIKGGKFLVNKDKSKYLNWMQYINPARNISEQNLQVFQYEHNLYYESTRQIQDGDELLVHFGEEYDDSLNRNIEMDFIPSTKHIFKDSFACAFCCLGFSSRSYLSKHKTICSGYVAGAFSIEELTQCPSCKIHLDQKEYILYHMADCCEKNDRKCILPDNSTSDVDGRKTRPRQMHKCQQCQYRTKYKADLRNHVSLHQEVKTNKCGICRRRFKTKEVLRLHVENAHIFGDVKEYSEDFTAVYVNGHVKPDHSCWQDDAKQFKCQLCEFQTRYKVSLERHMQVKHLKEFKYKYDMCDFKTNWKFNLKTHAGTKHLKVFKYKCDMCDFKTNQKFHLRTHMGTRHFKEVKYKCDMCDYNANQKSNLKVHVETKHLKEGKYKCDMCDYKAHQKFCLKSHIETRHLKEFKYKCGSCDYKSNSPSHLKRHIETIHLKEFKYKCDRCEYKANQKSQLKNHIDTKHLKQFKYKCDRCDYEANQKSHLRGHIETRHLKEFKYKCGACDYKTNLKSNLKKHTETSHLKQFKYKCDRCEYKANQKAQLRSHIEARHLNEVKYKCDACDYKSNWKFDLKKHIKTRHLKEFKYKCDRCDYKSNSQYHLKRHIDTIHLKAFKYQCDTCDYKANQKSQLKSHIETKHLKQFKYKCDTCEYKANQKSQLKSHIDTRHLKEFKYKCDMCDYKANQKSNLKTHIGTKHLK